MAFSLLKLTAFPLTTTTTTKTAATCQKLLQSTTTKTLCASIYSSNKGLRFKSTKKRIDTDGRNRDMCPPPPPKVLCGNEHMKGKDPCAKIKYGKHEKKKEPFKSMWLDSPCCKLPECPNMIERLDEKNWSHSDKLTRKYQRTWPDCPEFKLVSKKICDFEEYKMPQMEKRKPKDRPKTAQPLASEEDCEPKKITKIKCVRITLPGCKACRSPPKCVPSKKKSDCQKVCTPSPSFSECQRPKLRKRRPRECDCLDQVPMCKVFAYMRYLKEKKA